MQEKIAKILLQAKAVTLSPKDPYTFVSGIKSPIYCDNRLLISFPDYRTEVVDAYLKTIKDNNLEFDVLAGTSTAGIAWAAWLAEKLNKPMVYIRGKAKEHGKTKRIEGNLEKGQKVIVIEDLISTGGSSVSAVEAVREVGAKVVACVAIFTYEMQKAKDKFKEAKCTLYTLSNFSALIDVAIKEKYISADDKDNVLEWSKSPSEWGV